MTIDPYRWGSNQYRDDLAIYVYTGEERSVLFINVSNEMKKARDGEKVGLDARFYLTKRKAHVPEEVARKINRAMQDVLRESLLPTSGGQEARICEVQIPSGELLPSAEVAFRRLVQVALLKLDFIDRRRTAGRGASLVDLGRWLNPAEMQSALSETAADAEAVGGEESQLDEDDEGLEDLSKKPLNLILYGAPGTGKTYELTKHWFGKFRRELTTPIDNDVAFVEGLTWAELVAVVLHKLGGSSRVTELEQHPLIKAKFAATSIRSVRARLWSTLQRHTVDSSTTVNYSRRSSVQWFDKRPDSTWFLATPLPAELLDRPAPRATGSRVDDFVMVTFHQAYGYEDFIEGIRPRLDSEDDESGELAYSLEDGAFLRAVRAALRIAGYEGTLHDFCSLDRDQRARQFENALPYAVFIDEINRGNVARIFGELITLLEDDKRLGAENEVIVQLPHSKKRFGVPPNLHVIGTMNTADRSIEALDTALRRRFEFQEMAPRPEVVAYEVEGVRIDEMLRVINRRLEQLHDRDHCIGHAYFCALGEDPTLDRLKQIFRNKIIPLLQEYFPGDWGKIGLILGKPFVGKRASAGRLFAKFEHEESELLAERVIWELKDISLLGPEAFRQIYEDVASA